MSDILVSANSVSIYRGSSKTLELTVTDSSGNPVDLTGSEIVLTVKCDLKDENPEFQKRSTDPLQIDIYYPKGGKARIFLSPTDTSRLKPATYKFDVWVTLSTGKRYVVIPPSDFIVSRSVTVMM